jgi:tetratricopeptide (TPR) repeat protein
VALKVIKWGMDTREVLARFESERQALALMDHPGIARVYEAGATEQGRPYFAMEYVKGVAITEYCDTHRLTTAERLELFCRVCEGVQHAHQRGVIHRDMKPSNVLVTVQDDHPVPKIIDFGVAKATSQRLTERTVFTELGQWIGTPEYMSPEQAEMTGLDVDTRTDVYSLGVMLYELLVGAQPFDSSTLREAGFDEMRRRIREEEPPRPSTRVSGKGDDSEVAAKSRRTDPSTLMRELRGDLDWIVMKALEKDRIRRYSTPMDLAADIRRHMMHQPVEASPPSTPYRIGKFIRRHRLGVSAALLILITLAAGIVGTTAGLLRARREAGTARQVVRLMSGILEGLTPGDPTGYDSPIPTLLERGAERVDQELRGQPLVAAELKTIIGHVHRQLGDYDRANALFEQGLSLRRRNLGEDHPLVADSLGALGRHRLDTGRFTEARQYFDTALAIYDRQPAPARTDLAVTLNFLAHTLWRLGEYREAMEYNDRALATLEEVYGPDHPLVADALKLRGTLLREYARYDEALETLERCLAIREATFGPQHALVGEVHHDLGKTYLIQGNLEAARASQETALAIHEAAVGPDHVAVSYPLGELASIFIRQRDVESARPLIERALRIRERALGPDHADLALLLQPYSDLLLQTGDRDGARRALERALRITEAAYGENHIRVARILRALGFVEYRTDLAEGRRLQGRALAIVQKVFGPDSLNAGAYYYNLACIAVIDGNRDHALELLRRAVDTGWAWPGVLTDTDLDSLRGDPEFEALMDEIRGRLDDRALR